MRVSTKTRYGLRIILQLAEALPDGKAVKGKELVSVQGISEPYMEQIMIKFRKAGWVVTERGCQGGYKLNIAPESVSILDFIELFEGTLELVSCMDQDKRCINLDKCKTSASWHMLAESFQREAKKFSLAKIIDLNSEIKEYVI
ncbi:MAG: Rrf2 family transcriptional regulator [Victivallales bacterium]|nr:Rrf2 family transcriptional regulator [Victivallales bacterium]